MADEQQTEIKADPLDTILSDAIEEHYVEDTPSPGREPPPQAELPLDDDRPRDERGRFASGPKPSQDPPKVQPAADAQPDPASLPIEPPRNYAAELKAQFGKLPREQQQWLVNTERQREAEYTRRSQEAAEIRRYAEPLMQAVSPFMGYLSQVGPSIGQHPVQMLNGILSTEYRLRTSPPVQQVQALGEIAQAYNIPREAVVAYFAHGQLPAQHQQSQATSRQFDPVIQQQEQRLRMLEQERAYERQTQEQQKVLGYIEEFKNERDEHGNLKRPDFEELRTTMAISLANNEFNDLSERAALEAAYRKAEGPMQAVLKRRMEASRTTMDRQTAVDRARRAAPVRSSVGGNGTTHARGLDAVIGAAIEKSGAFSS